MLSDSHFVREVGISDKSRQEPATMPQKRVFSFETTGYGYSFSGASSRGSHALSS